MIHPIGLEGGLSKWPRPSDLHHLSSRVLTSEIICDFIERLKRHPFVRHYVLSQPLEHQKYLRSTTNIRVDGDWKHSFIILSVDEIKLVSPHLFYVSRIGESMAIRSLFYKHHRR